MFHIHTTRQLNRIKDESYQRGLVDGNNQRQPVYYPQIKPMTFDAAERYWSKVQAQLEEILEKEG